MALSKQQMECIGYMLEGHKVSDIARLVDCNRVTIYDWLKKEEFKAELDRQQHEIKTQVRNNIIAKSEPVIDKIIKIALTSKSEKTSLDACTYLIDHVLGKSTSKVADVTETETKQSIDLKAELKEIGNIIDLKKAN